MSEQVRLEYEHALLTNEMWRNQVKGGRQLKWLAAVFFAAGILAASACAQPPVPAAAKKQAVSPTPTKATKTESNTDHKAVGSKSAPIVMEVFSDYQCPACRELYLSTLRPLIENYVNTGKIYLVHRDMPLAAHQYSRVAARYVNAAAKLNKLERAVEAVYLTQDKWSADGNVEGAIARVLTPTEMKKVRALVQGGTLEPGIDSDVALGTKFRVNQTPTTIMTHRGQTYPIVGVMSYNVLKRFIDDLLVNK